jgi:hypothetical protein
MSLGRVFVEQHNPALAKMLAHPMLQNSLTIGEALAHIGSRGRTVYQRRYGTKPVTRI